MMSQDNFRDVPGLLASLAGELRQLFSTELALAKAEVSRNTARAARALWIGIAAFLLALAGLQTVAASAVIALVDAGLGWGAAALAVGAACLVLAFVLTSVAKTRLSAKTLIPRKAAQQVKRDLALTQEMSRG